VNPTIKQTMNSTGHVMGTTHNIRAQHPRAKHWRNSFMWN